MNQGRIQLAVGEPPPPARFRKVGITIPKEMYLELRAEHERVESVMPSEHDFLLNVLGLGLQAVRGMRKQVEKANALVQLATPPDVPPYYDQAGRAW